MQEAVSMTLANARELARCSANLHDALHVAPDFSGVEVALRVAHHVQPLDRVLTSVLRQILVRLVGLHLLSCRRQQDTAQSASLRRPL